MKTQQQSQYLTLCDNLETIVEDCPLLMFKARALEKQIKRSMKQYHNKPYREVHCNIVEYRLKYENLQRQAQEYKLGDDK